MTVPTEILHPNDYRFPKKKYLQSFWKNNPKLEQALLEELENRITNTPIELGALAFALKQKNKTELSAYEVLLSILFAFLHHLKDEHSANAIISLILYLQQDNPIDKSLDFNYIFLTLKSLNLFSSHKDFNHFQIALLAALESKTNTAERKTLDRILCKELTCASAIEYQKEINLKITKLLDGFLIEDNALDAILKKIDVCYLNVDDETASLTDISFSSDLLLPPLPLAEQITINNLNAREIKEILNKIKNTIMDKALSDTDKIVEIHHIESLNPDLLQHPEIKSCLTACKIYLNPNFAKSHKTKTLPIEYHVAPIPQVNKVATIHLLPPTISKILKEKFTLLRKEFITMIGKHQSILGDNYRKIIGSKIDDNHLIDLIKEKITDGSSLAKIESLLHQKQLLLFLLSGKIQFLLDEKITAETLLTKAGKKQHINLKPSSWSWFFSSLSNLRYLFYSVTSLAEILHLVAKELNIQRDFFCKTYNINEKTSFDSIYKNVEEYTAFSPSEPEKKQVSFLFC